MVKKGLFRIYLSHPIHGKKGDKATKKDIYNNCMKVQKVAEEIKAYLLDWCRMDGFPKMDLYVPAEHDEFIQITYDDKLLTIDQILDVDCKIVQKCSMLIAYGSISSGMARELDCAQANGIPIFSFKVWNQWIPSQLKKCIRLVIEGSN
jgi:hypothetical protein